MKHLKNRKIMDRRSFLRNLGIGTAIIAAGPIVIKEVFKSEEKIYTLPAQDEFSEISNKVIETSRGWCYEAEAEARRKFWLEMEYNFLFGELKNGVIVLPKSII